MQPTSTSSVRNSLVRRIALIATTAVLCSFPQCARATTLAADTAADTAYLAESDGAWKGVDPTADENPPGMDNGGFGYQAWDFSGGYHQPQFSPYGRLNHFIDDVDFAASSYNNLGSPVFALTNANLAFGGHTARATRIFDEPLSAGKTVTVDFDNPQPASLDPFAPAGFLLRLNSGGGPVISDDSSVMERFGLFVTSGFNGDNWTVTDSTGFIDTGVDANETTSGANLKFTLTSPSTYQFELTRISDGHSYFTRTGSLAAPSAGAIDSLEITMFGNGSGNGRNGPTAQPTGEREFFFNDLRIESGATTLLGDYNRNGTVDAADYVVWRETLNDTGTGLPADGNQDGKVDASDYGVWRSQFGSAPGPAVGASESLPEPGTYIATVSAAGYLLTLHKWRARIVQVRNVTYSPNTTQSSMSLDRSP